MEEKKYAYSKNGNKLTRFSRSQRMKKRANFALDAISNAQEDDKKFKKMRQMEGEERRRRSS